MSLFSWFSKKTDEPENVPEENAVAEEPRTRGPWDINDGVDTSGHVDAGILILPYFDDMTMQFSVDQNKNIVVGAVYVMGSTALQLQVFAAPSSANLWREIQGDIITSIAEQGGNFEESTGPYGDEIHARMPGEHVSVPVRFIGIDGPRWLLRVAVTGEGAQDIELGNSMLERVLDGVVVNRGDKPHLPRELIPLALPQDISLPENFEITPH